MLMYYLIAVNVLAFALMGIDKAKARRGAWRIPEKFLFLAAVIGGSVGALLGMYTFRHKTRHRSFVIGMPVILLLQAAAAAWLMR
ncbi:MAG: DUF1294 domain-containing protein [Oscillospiraceae bacterium]